MVAHPLQLALEFQCKFKCKYGYNPYSMATIQTSKWWPHFRNFSDTTKLTDEYIIPFIRRLFDEWKEPARMYPYVLSQKTAEILANNIVDAKEKCKGRLSEKDYIKMTLEKCNQWCMRKGVETNKLQHFIMDKTNQMMANRGNFYKPLFQFSTKYIEEYGITKDEQLKKNAIRAFFPQVYETLKQSLQDDFID